MPPQPEPHSFTAEYSRTVRALITPVLLSTGFDPQKTKPYPAPKKFNAIWDTGATNCVITRKAIDQCDLKPIGAVQVHHGGGIQIRAVFLVNLGLPNKVGFAQIRATEGDIAGADVLLGMDIISGGDFAITQQDGKTTFSFRIPSAETINFVKQKKSIPTPAQPTPKVGRNHPCPCGSGKKYKKCCGAI